MDKLHGHDENMQDMFDCVMLYRIRDVSGEAVPVHTYCLGACGLRGAGNGRSLRGRRSTTPRRNASEALEALRTV